MLSGGSSTNAIRRTIDNRGTRYENDSFERIVSLIENEVLLSRWGVFKRKQNIPIEFVKVMEVLDLFLRDVAESKLNGEQFKKMWNPDESLWK